MEEEKWKKKFFVYSNIIYMITVATYFFGLVITLLIVRHPQGSEVNPIMRFIIELNPYFAFIASFIIFIFYYFGVVYLASKRDVGTMKWTLIVMVCVLGWFIFDTARDVVLYMWLLSHLA